VDRQLVAALRRIRKQRPSNVDKRHPLTAKAPALALALLRGGRPGLDSESGVVVWQCLLVSSPVLCSLGGARRCTDFGVW
jgi:hypothetical protein